MTNVTLTASQTTQVFSNGAVLVASQTAVTCFFPGSATWLSARANANGLQVTVYLDKTYSPSVTAGLLGIYDNSTANDLALKSGTVLTLTQDGVNTAFTDWKVLSGTDSLFIAQPISPVADPGWTALYWSAAWNQSQLVQTLFVGNDSLFAAANQSCSAQLSTSNLYQNCLMEYSDCVWNQPAPAACSAAYLDQLNDQSIADFGCDPPKWNTIIADLSVTEGTPFQLPLTGLLNTSYVGVTFSKVSGPVNLNVVSATGNLTWTPPSLSDLLPIIVSATSSTGCSSLLQLGVQIKRTAIGVCPNSVESFDYLTSMAGESYRRDKIYQSMCKCNTNYYTGNCSFGTCQLDCHTCDATTCAAACPLNYLSIDVSALKVCAYTDSCTGGYCLGGTPFRDTNACRSVSPELQTATQRYQCVCAAGYQYPSSGNKTVCEDINECELRASCDLSKNFACTNSPGSFTCQCKPGYTPSSPGLCVDINECNSTGICPNGNCVNTPGSYYCNCSAGFYAPVIPGPAAPVVQNCTDIDECANPALSGCKQVCNNTQGSYTCGCYSGFSAPPVCPATNTCTNASVCAYAEMCAKVSTADTCFCPLGQLVNADSRTCNATRFCTSDAICGVGGTCTEASPMGYNCTCKQYYELNAAKKCVPSDYCNRPSQYPSVCPSGDNVQCMVNNLTNAPTCGCAIGYARNPVTNTCDDINECTNSSNCDPDSADCFNLVGSYICTCKFGYKRINTTFCRPAPYAYRVQTTFSDRQYKSTYADPTSADFRFMADSIEGQLAKALPSDGGSQPTVRVLQLRSGSVIADTVVTYDTSKTISALESGARSSGLTVTASVTDRCASNLTNECIPAQHICSSTGDGYTCTCKPGYTQTKPLSGFAGTTNVIYSCVDIDECLTQCRNGTNQVCTNQPGTYTCSCARGFYSRNATASLLCEAPCTAGWCQNGGVCQTQLTDPVPFRCVCQAGYSGMYCESTDENYKGMQRNAIIIGVVLGVLLLLCILGLAIFFVRKYRNNKNKADFYQSNFSDTPVSQSGGTYKGMQGVALSDTAIPRAHPTSHHPSASAYENTAYERETHRTRTDYF